MIRSVRIRGFKRFREVEFRLPGHVVLAGPNCRFRANPTRHSGERYH